MNNATILVTDDEKAHRLMMRGHLEDAGYTVLEAGDGMEALSIVQDNQVDLVLLDLMMPRLDGIQTLPKLKAMVPDLPVIMMTAFSTLESAVAALKMGATDYLAKPLDMEELVLKLARSLKESNLTRQVANQARRLGEMFNFSALIGHSEPILRLKELLAQVAQTSALLLITGESGTGKEVVAQIVHQNSDRKDLPLVKINCAALPENLLESELFGHEKGAFTGAIKSKPGRFELANGGTIFLDEIGDMSPALQVKLLRALQEHQFERVGGTRTITTDIRVIAATHRDLRKKVEDGSFREDLYYRLNVIPINVPPLRERRGDIALLCQHFLTRLSDRKGLEKKQMYPEVLEALMRYSWPGNVRELENLLERMVILASGSMLQLDDLPPKLRETRLNTEIKAIGALEVPDSGLDFNAAVDDFERGLILQALDKTSWVKNQAAQLLGLNRTTLVEKIKKKGLVEPVGKGAALL